MSDLPARIIALSAAAVAALVVSTGPASAAPACEDAVSETLHAAHDITGDPAGLVHEAEETYCSIGG